MKHIFCWLCFLCLKVNQVIGNLPPETAQYIQVAPQYKPCFIVINEVNFATKTRQYVELAKYCPPKPRNAGNEMKLFKIAFVNAGGEIIIVCDLNGHLQNNPGFENGRQFFYLLGGNDVNNADKKLGDCQRDVEYKDNFPTGNEHPFAILLLFNALGKISNYESINLIQDKNNLTQFKRKRITLRQTNRIKNHMADYIVLGSTTIFSDCHIFRTISSNFSPRGTVIYRDWKTNIAEDISLNRCGLSNEPFQPEGMRYSNPSPGFDNKCEDSIAFSLEDAIEKNPVPIRVELNVLNHCYIGNHNTQDGRLVINNNILDEEFQPNAPIVDADLECDELMDVVFDIEDDEIIRNQTYAENINSYLNFFDHNLVKPNPYIWPNCSSFNNSILDKISSSIDESVILNDNVCYWFDYKESDDDLPKATCNLCSKLYKKGILLDRSSSPLLSTFIKSGQWHKGPGKKRDNRNMIRSHLSNKLHKISMQYFNNLDVGLRNEEFNKAMMMPDKEYYRFFATTERFIISVYQSVRLSLPYQKFPILTDTLRYANLDIGELHLNEHGVKKGIQIISKCLHKELLFHMITNQPYFSIILDDSSDVKGIPNCAILFQTFDTNQNIQMYHYSLLQLKYGGKGLKIFKTFFEQITKDNLLFTLQTQLVSMVSDGARTLQSVFHRELQTKTNNTLIHVHCHGHKLELVVKNAFKTNKYLDAMDKKVNQIARFFNNKAVKRRAMLKEEAARKVTYDEAGNIMLRNTRFEIKRVHNIRWITHHLTAYESILDHWEELVKTFKSIRTSKNTEFTDEIRDKATMLLDYLLDATFLAHLGFLADIAEAFSRVSLILQTKNSNLIGKKELRIQLYNSIINYSTIGGRHLLKLLRNAEIASPNDEIPSTFIKRLEDFEYSFVELNKTNLNVHRPSNVSNTLTDYLPAYMNAIFGKLNFYFPDGMPSNDFDIFYPPNLQRITPSGHTGRFELGTMNYNYRWGLDINALYNSFVLLINSVVNDSKFNKKRQLAPEKFWTHYLRAENIIWNEDIRKVVKILLVMPATSSSAEQSFSIVNAIKTTRRYSLETESADAELRIKLNGEKHISRINSFTYAREFVKDYRRPDDQHRAVPILKDDDEKDSNGNRYKTIFERSF